jgi:hypothetical protein
MLHPGRTVKHPRHNRTWPMRPDWLAPNLPSIPAQAGLGLALRTLSVSSLTIGFRKRFYPCEPVAFALRILLRTIR